ncbi:hypothetical protein QBC34DRAFT_389848 [Podospora aff. communis PSN243]|uniref:DUF805 domain-containing protein n=1 Tax=Podospora aff. communis PSN243 TaxID=3040156 RepID=A0AAV9H408_9PEZI|nr:hypothetical protein QBC34DRAFT_389848 [Podospora aff. communis PSN243]
MPISTAYDIDIECQAFEGKGRLEVYTKRARRIGEKVIFLVVWAIFMGAPVIYLVLSVTRLGLAEIFADPDKLFPVSRLFWVWSLCAIGLCFCHRRYLVRSSHIILPGGVFLLGPILNSMLGLGSGGRTDR